ncbi:hypothetical protein KPH14_004265 [Odynerus spinipes]|uniref:Uncharacterized protein n=1 Tax=Odynerus spinipes TaxID=1348599 RepID=A0AAD9RYE7_9HYME|nr:hypothetical protein KPH14_004265 [Odynerus spinipes]
MSVSFDFRSFHSPIFLCFLAILFNVGCTAYTPPNATVQPLYPKGLRISVPHEQGITLVAYHVKFNDDFYSLEAGTISIDIIKPRNGRWVYEDHTTELKEGDIIYFWVHVVYQGLGYNLLNQEHRVTEFFNYDGTLVREIEPGVCDTPSITKILDKDGKLQNVCPNQLLFQDNFDNLNETQWTVLEQFSNAPDYEFVVYRNSPDNVKVQDGKLLIIPTFVDEKFGVEFVRRGSMTLEKCTSTAGSNDCQREAVGSYILPPIMSGRLNSKGSFAFVYGRIEVRAKLPRGDWIYPLLHLEVVNEHKQEGLTPPLIRIASASGNPVLKSPEGTDLSGHVLCAGRLLPVQTSHGQSPHATRQGLLRRTNNVLWSQDYHIYEIHWQKDRILAKVDGTIYGEQKINAPFDQPFYLNLGLAVGGRGEFADFCVSSNYTKPWRNVASKAVLDFYEARDNWINTWKGSDTDLEIDYVKVWSL